MSLRSGFRCGEERLGKGDLRACPVAMGRQASGIGLWMGV